MGNTVNITPILESIITIKCMVVSYFLIPYIKSKLTAAQWSNLQQWAEIGVKAAEVLFNGTKLGKDKREYVFSVLESLCQKHGYDFDEDSIRLALENAWKNMTDNELQPIEYTAEISE